MMYEKKNVSKSFNVCTQLVNKNNVFSCYEENRKIKSGVVVILNDKLLFFSYNDHISFILLLQPYFFLKMMDCTFDFIVTLYIRTRELTYIQQFSYFKRSIII